MSPGRLLELSELFDKLYALQKKHNVISVEQLQEVKKELEEKLKVVGNIADLIHESEKNLENKLSELKIKGKQLTLLRNKGIDVLESQIKQLLSGMAMPYAELKVDLDSLENPTSQGFENIEFKIRTNKGSRHESIAKVASGGELSRVMLAIKAILSKEYGVSSIIFDEIDTGVSGEVAVKMAEIMEQMSSGMQVICITHLPQIASSGKHHYKVEKKETEDSTKTDIQLLSTEDRLIEIAKMLSGDSPSEAAISNARELLNQKR